MSELSAALAEATAASPLVLCDRLISLAQAADRAGYVGTAGQLVQLALTMFGDDAIAPAPRERPNFRRRARPAGRHHGPAARSRAMLNA